MKKEIAGQVGQIIEAYDPMVPGETAVSLRALWLKYEPKSMAGIKAEQRKKQETVGIPVPVLKAIGKELAKVAQKRVDDFIPLTRLLWDEYGREGRVVTLIPLGKMELAAPESIIPLLMEMCRSCITWEDADRMGMDALEPIVRKLPEQWLDSMDHWLDDENKWVRRAGVIAVGRLPMKHAAYTERCLKMIERLLFDEEVDVKKAVSFAIRLCARGEIVRVRDLLDRHVPPDNVAATWVLCDVIRSMTPNFLPSFVSLLPSYERWAADSALSSKDRRSVESAIKKLHSVSY
ncbi:MAG: DNA alkylation repair protein [Chloroflexi bacterium]|nr:MAG: DNA alkylation repair protein [Chloroflexota bacterium]